eukprot:8991356-Pyramimonas_sp.AAC.1
MSIQDGRPPSQRAAALQRGPRGLARTIATRTPLQSQISARGSTAPGLTQSQTCFITWRSGSKVLKTSAKCSTDWSRWSSVPNPASILTARWPGGRPPAWRRTPQAPDWTTSKSYPLHLSEPFVSRKVRWPYYFHNSKA